MNRFLAEAAAVLNAVGAVATIVGCALLGGWLFPVAVQAYAQAAGVYVRQNPADLQMQGFIWGLLAGFLLAIMAHGFLAVMIAMHKELKAIRDLLRR